MRIGRKLVLVVGLVAALAGVVAAIAGGQLQMVQNAGQAKPRTMTINELAETGSGGNAHVELTGIKFGKPVIDKGKDGEWLTVWLPVLPARATAKPLSRSVFLRTTHVDDQADLDSLLKQSTLAALVSSALPSSSVFVQKPSIEFWKSEPSLDPSKALFLCDAQLDLNGTPILAGEQLFNRTFALAAWAAVGVAFTLVLIGLAVGSKPRERTGALAPDLAAHREALFQESAISRHHGMYGKYIALTVFGALIGVPLLGGLGIAAAHSALNELARAPLAPDQLGYVAGLAAVGAFVVGILYFLTSAAIVWVRSAIAEVIMCNHGLRWRVGKKWDAVLWTDVKSVTRGESIVMRNGVEVGRHGICRVTLRDGREIALHRDGISDYPQLADAIQATTNNVVAAERQRDLANGEATFGPVAVKKDGLVFNGRDVPWDNLERYEVINGHLVIYRRRSWFFRTLELPLAQIPDYMALLDILQMRGDGYVTRGLTVTGGMAKPGRRP